MAKSVHVLPGSDTIDRARYFALAEEAYLRAIALGGRYLRPRYGLAVLYVFELERPAEAIPHLERCLEISRGDVDTMFVLARAYYMTESFQAAIDLYDRIISITKDEQKRSDARSNREIAMGMMYG
jgi:tetratricopeptide (TPR) repeat protein